MGILLGAGWNNQPAPIYIIVMISGIIETMTVYVDDAYIPAKVKNRGRSVSARWCHMTADSTEELHAMADRIGLRRSWVQNPGTWIGRQWFT